jgi:hypothetical protein
MLFAVLDLARDRRIEPTVTRNPGDFCCVENARLSPQTRSAAPYLVRLRKKKPLAAQLLDGGWGANWGVFAAASKRKALETMRLHFHALLRVRLPDGQPVIFRYYDPRVLRVFLPTCSADQLKELFGPVREYWMEDEDPETLLRFSFDGRQLLRTRIDLTRDPPQESPPEALPPPSPSAGSR